MCWRRCARWWWVRRQRCWSANSSVTPTGEILVDLARTRAELRQEVIAQRRQGDSGRVRADVDGSQHSSLRILDRNRDGAHAVLEFLIDQRLTLFADGVEFCTQRIRSGNGAIGACSEVRVGQVAIKLKGGKGGKQHATHGRAVRGQASSDGQSDGHDAVCRRSSDVHDLG